MSEEQKSNRRTVVVIESETLVRPDGRAGIGLLIEDQETEKEESIAFEVTLLTIARLRQDLSDAEQHILKSRNQNSS
jgi:hypothetical protein